MRGYGMINLNEFAERIHLEHMKGIKKKRLAIAIAVAVAAGGWVYQYDKARTLAAAVRQMADKNETVTKELTTTKSELNAIKQAMTVSIDARRLGRPVRLSGEMIVVFAGEVKP